jgi:hypothetical protein
MVTQATRKPETVSQPFGVKLQYLHVNQKLCPIWQLKITDQIIFQPKKYINVLESMKNFSTN